MTTSKVGSVRYKVYGALLLVNTIVLALSAHINHFQEFFYIADIFPLALSVVTMAFVATMIALDVRLQNAFTARPPFELSWLFVFGTLWLSFNAFSTSRWRYVSMGLCSTIPPDAQYAPYRTWCHELQALRAFIWIEWVMLLLTFAFLLRWTITQHNAGWHDVWTTSFSRFAGGDEDAAPARAARYRGDTNSEFLQWEKFPVQQQEQQQQQHQEYLHQGYQQQQPQHQEYLHQGYQPQQQPQPQQWQQFEQQQGPVVY